MYANNIQFTKVEIQIIKRALIQTNRIQSHAAKLLGIGKSGLNQKIKKYGLEEFVKGDDGL